MRMADSTGPRRRSGEGVRPNLTGLDEVSYPHLATGSVDIDSAGRIWFAPIADYQVLRYRQDGTLEQRITRDHAFDFNPRPYTSVEDIGGGRSRVSFDRDRAFVARVQLDRVGRTWSFIRDSPANQMVVDVFGIDGRFLQSHIRPLDSNAEVSCSAVH